MDFVQLVAQDCPVSIHAPARGATIRQSCLDTKSEFQFAPRAGAWIETSNIQPTLLVVKATPPRGGRQA